MSSKKDSAMYSISKKGKTLINGNKNNKGQKRKQRKNKTNTSQISLRQILDFNAKELKNLKKQGKFNNTTSEIHEDSKQEGIRIFKKIIAPTKYETFFDQYWERKPLLIKRGSENYYKNWFSCAELETILRNNDLEFTQNIDVTSYINGEKAKHNIEGKAYAPLVWDFFQQGMSIRLLNPATYSKHLWQYQSALQELFLTSVGSNVYLTPPSTQGFAPHYDDIDAFVLQLEGKKHWRVYAPRNESEKYPIYSSRNFNQDEIGEPIIDCILEEGDLLYFPRGFIHQANACDDIHSLHITVSCYQKTTYGDFLSKVLTGGLEIAIEEDEEFRKNLPIGYLDLGGTSYSNGNDINRNKFIEKVVKLGKKVIEKYLPIDAAMDQCAKTFLQDSLPPFLKTDEKNQSIHGSGEKWSSEKKRVECIAEIEPNTYVKLIKRHCLRLVEEGSNTLMYYNMENSRVYQEKEIKYLEIENDAADAIRFLLNSYPKYVSVDDLPLKDVEERINVASSLYDHGLLVTRDKLAYAFDDDDEDD